MNLLQVYNEYRAYGGEDVVVRRTAALIEKHGGRARLISRSSRALGNGLRGKLAAFLSGIYSASAYREVQRCVRQDRPDVVHVHNLYPLFSPSVLVALRRAGLPVVLSVHNHHLTCPRTDHLCRSEICERCVGGKEYHCLLRNCRNNLAESFAYALRSAVARQLQLFHHNTTLVVALTEFARQRLIRAGFDPDRVVVLYNMLDAVHSPVDPAGGEYVAFAGRLSPEKGIETLLAAAAATGVPVRIAGDGPLLDSLKRAAPPNVTFCGQLDHQAMNAFYRGARFLVLSSRCFEMCPLVISEAMAHGLPVIGSRIGGLSELVDDGVTGLLFESGQDCDLAEKIRRLWAGPELCRSLGAAAHEKAMREYGEPVYYRRLVGIYRRAIDLAGGTRSAPALATA